ncbi:MAG: acyl-[acyl-carrier-protein] thioesterase [Candidatus Gastranaerophilaceae bacterium]
MLDKTSPFYKERKLNVRYSEMDYHKVLKPSALLNFLQDVATFAADEGGFGYDEVVSRNLGWFLLKYRMEFENYPQNIEDIIIQTEARGYNKLFAHRDFELFSQSGERLGKVLSYWALVNFEDKSMAMPNVIFPNKFNKVEKREDDLSFAKVHAPERIDYREEFKIRYDDIDVNMHVNNMNYIAWAFEVLPKEFKDKYKLKTLDMVYKKEIQYGNQVLSEAQVDDNLVRVVVKNNSTGEDLCIVNAEFVEYK